MMCPKDPFSEKMEREFLAWLRKKPSILGGEGQCEACHIRVVGKGAGTGRKPRLCAVPLTPPQHRLQSQQGYLITLAHFRKDVKIPYPANEKFGIEWFLDQAMNFRREFLAEFYPGFMGAV